MLKNAVFDFGQVILRFDARELVTHYFPQSEWEEILATVFPKEVWEVQDEGFLTPQAFTEQFRGKTKEENLPRILALASGWEQYAPLISGMPELVAGLRARGVKTYLLSNISRRFFDAGEAYPPFRMFDGTLLSSEIHIKKPDARIYQALLDKFSLRGEECLFVDDREINLRGAEKLGFTTYLFDGSAEKLKERTDEWFREEK